MSIERDRIRLRHMLDAAEKIVAFTEGLSPAPLQRTSMCPICAAGVSGNCRA